MNCKFSFLFEKSFWNLSSLLHNLTYLSSKKPQLLLLQKTCLRSSLSRFPALISYTMWSSNRFLHPGVSLFFKLHVFLDPSFSGSGSRF